MITWQPWLMVLARVGIGVRVIAQLGIADQVRSKLIRKAAIQGGAESVAKGDADVGLYLVSEAQAAKGIPILATRLFSRTTSRRRNMHL